MPADGYKPGLAANLEQLIQVSESRVLDVMIWPIDNSRICHSAKIGPQQTTTVWRAARVLDAAERASRHLAPLNQRCDKTKGIERVTDLIARKRQICDDAARIVDRG